MPLLNASLLKNDSIVLHFIFGNLIFSTPEVFISFSAFPSLKIKPAAPLNYVKLLHSLRAF